MRKEYMIDLEQNIRGRLLEARMVNQDFLLQMIQMWQKKIGSKMNKYLATNNEEFANEIDLKDIDKYLKTLDILQRISAEPKSGGNPTVGLNLGEGVTIERHGNTVEITPKTKAIGDMLKQFADFRREEESKK
jgi:hypothetical protein